MIQPREVIMEPVSQTLDEELVCFHCNNNHHNNTFGFCFNKFFSEIG